MSSVRKNLAAPKRSTNEVPSPRRKNALQRHRAGAHVNIDGCVTSTCAYAPVYIDEMNFVELPFSLLTRDDHGIQVFEMAPGTKLIGNPVGVREALLREGFEEGETGIWHPDAGGLPTALGAHVFLAMMALTWQRNNFQEDKLEFELPELIRTMYPDRTYKPGQTIMMAVEEQIWRLVHTRLTTDRWYDAEVKERRHMDATIIQDASSEGVKLKSGQTRRLWITWGQAFIKSVQSGYIKSLNDKAYMSLSSPLDRNLYRWLDRQLASKREQSIHCQWLARKLAMNDQETKEGGRRASSRIVRQLALAIENYKGHEFREAIAAAGADFRVEMHVNKSHVDFLLTFKRIDGALKNEIVEHDDAADLVTEFYRVAHGRTNGAGAKPVRVGERDRKEAAKWIDEYSLEQACWMVGRCVELHKQGKQWEAPLHSFKGLEFYRQVAASEWATEKARQRVKIEQQGTESEDAAWKRYLKQKIEEAEAIEPYVLQALERESCRLAEAEASAMDEYLRECHVTVAARLHLNELKLRAVRMLSEEEFKRQHRDDRAGNSEVCTPSS